MNRTVWIPVAGTIAAVLAVLLTRATLPARLDASPAAPEEPPWVDEETDPAPDLPNPFRDVDEQRIVSVFLEEDGTFLRDEPRTSFATAEELLEALAPEGAPRPTVVLITRSDKVPKEAVEAAREKLGARCDVRVYERGGAEGG